MSTLSTCTMYLFMTANLYILYRTKLNLYFLDDYHLQTPCSMIWIKYAPYSVNCGVADDATGALG